MQIHRLSYWWTTVVPMLLSIAAWFSLPFVWGLQSNLFYYFVGSMMLVCAGLPYLWQYLAIYSLNKTYEMNMGKEIFALNKLLLIALVSFTIFLGILPQLDIDLGILNFLVILVSMVSILWGFFKIPLILSKQLMMIHPALPSNRFTLCVSLIYCGLGFLYFKKFLQFEDK